MALNIKKRLLAVFNLDALHLILKKLESMDKKKRCRIVLFPFPFQGHINPMMQLARILHSKGFIISIIQTRYNSLDTSKYPHFTFHVISDGLSDTPTSLSDSFIIIKTLMASCIEPFDHCLAQLCSDVSSDRVVCLISDAAWYFTQAIAEKYDLPRIVLRTSSIGSVRAFAALHLLWEKGYFSKRDSEMEAAVEELPPLKVKDIPTFETPYLDLYDIVHSFVEETKKASGLIFNTFKELEESELSKLVNEQFVMPIFPIGPFHKFFSAASSSLLTQDRSSISWLETRAPNSVLDVSFGSVAAMDEKSLLEVAWGLANSEQQFLWVVRPGSVCGSEWQEMIPEELLSLVSERSHIVKWAPQQGVLSHPSVGVFLTHSGWNSTMESICEGVPMICSPFFGNQMVDSRYVNDVWKIGIKLEKGMERGEIEEAIKRLMSSGEGDEIRQRAVCLKNKVDQCSNEAGSSSQALDGLVDFILSFQSSA